MVGSNLIKLGNGLKAFDVGDAGDFTKFVCYATGKTVEPAQRPPPYVTCLSRCPRPDFGCREAPQGLIS